MNHASIASLQRRLSHLQDQAARFVADQSPPLIRTRWGGTRDQGERVPGVTYIMTDWSNGAALEREDN